MCIWYYTTMTFIEEWESVIPNQNKGYHTHSNSNTHSILYYKKNHLLRSCISSYVGLQELSLDLSHSWGNHREWDLIVKVYLSESWGMFVLGFTWKDLGLCDPHHVLFRVLKISESTIIHILRNLYTLLLLFPLKHTLDDSWIWLCLLYMT